MHILLDENLLSKKLKQPLLEAGHSVSNVDDMGWRGYKDRQILEMATAHPFDLFITADKNLPFQQNLSAYEIRILVLDVSNTKPSHLLPLIIQLSSQLIPLFEARTAIKINDVGEITIIA
jgi:predicted nuclease of predicted toxin-antitoxin system